MGCGSSQTVVDHEKRSSKYETIEEKAKPKKSTPEAKTIEDNVDEGKEKPKDMFAVIVGEISKRRVVKKMKDFWRKVEIKKGFNHAQTLGDVEVLHAKHRTVVSFVVQQTKVAARIDPANAEDFTLLLDIGTGLTSITRPQFEGGTRYTIELGSVPAFSVLLSKEQSANIKTGDSLFRTIEGSFTYAYLFTGSSYKLFYLHDIP